MPREATLFDTAGGSVIRGYFLLKSGGSPNVPPMWIERARLSRKGRERELARIMRDGRIQDFPMMESWELSYRKECFYRGLRILLELERGGKSTL